MVVLREIHLTALGAALRTETLEILDNMVVNIWLRTGVFIYLVERQARSGETYAVPWETVGSRGEKSGLERENWGGERRIGVK